MTSVTLLKLLNSITDTKHHTSVSEILFLHGLLNNAIFDNMLGTPTIKISNYCRRYWAYCQGDIKNEKPTTLICLHDRWKSLSFLITVLGHEMIHQYQWESGVEYYRRTKSDPMDHGDTFYAFADKFDYFNIPLNEAYNK